MRILILNWRDPRHPGAGGAESYTRQLARRLVEKGDAVEWFAASFPGAARTDDIDGIGVIRAGRQATVHLQAMRRYRGKLRGRFDVVVDEVNTIPFFTPLWAGIPAFMLIHQLAREVWWYESRFPINALGYALEPLYLRAYRHTPVFAMSPSTRKDLLDLGFRGPVMLLPQAFEPIPEISVTKAEIPTFLYVGRLAASKRIVEIITAFKAFRDAVGPSRLWLVGDGPQPYRQRLERFVTANRLQTEVLFLGRLSPEEKHQRMRRAHALLMASVREGWGIVVTEANACGTPAVVYDVHGLRDSVRDGLTGLVVQPTPARLTDGMLRIWRDAPLRKRLGDEALRWSRSFSFDIAAAQFRQALLESLS